MRQTEPIFMGLVGYRQRSATHGAYDELSFLHEWCIQPHTYFYYRDHTTFSSSNDVYHTLRDVDRIIVLYAPAEAEEAPAELDV
jgi:hypothetical protein